MKFKEFMQQTVKVNKDIFSRIVRVGRILAENLHLRTNLVEDEVEENAGSIFRVTAQHH